MDSNTQDFNFPITDDSRGDQPILGFVGVMAIFHAIVKYSSRFPRSAMAVKSFISAA